jgi:putative transposase
VAERFNRTLKEQVIHGQVFQNPEKVRKGGQALCEQLHPEWPVEKNGFLSPWQIKAQGLPRAQSPERLKNDSCPENRVRC